MRWSAIVLAVVVGSASSASAQQKHQNPVIDLWAQGKPAFGVYAPNENPGPRGQRGQPPQPAVYTREGGEKLAPIRSTTTCFSTSKETTTPRRLGRWRQACGAQKRSAARR